MRNRTFRRRLAAVLGTCLCTLALPATAAETQRIKTVGGGMMDPSRTVIENVARSKDHTIFVAALTASGLADRLRADGPYTVFAPTNAAFLKLPVDARDARVLASHIVPGLVTSQDVIRLVKEGGGRASLTTLAGDTLTVTPAEAYGFMVTDMKGHAARVTIPDLIQVNGVMHVTDAVLLPE